MGIWKNQIILQEEKHKSNSWEFCSGQAAVSWPWSIFRGSAGGKWREEPGDASSREKSPLYLSWVKEMGTQFRKSQTREANTNCPIPVFLDPGRQMQESSSVCVAASLQGGPQRPPPARIHTPVLSFLPHWTTVGLSDQQNMTEVMVWYLSD